jgi:hypothetical protein
MSTLPGTLARGRALDPEPPTRGAGAPGAIFLLKMAKAELLTAEATSPPPSNAEDCCKNERRVVMFNDGAQNHLQTTWLLSKERLAPASLVGGSGSRALPRASVPGRVLMGGTSVSWRRPRSSCHVVKLPSVRLRLKASKSESVLKKL